MHHASTHVLPTHTTALFEEAVAEAARRLRGGEVVALPTETVYGLAANALDPCAVRRIYAIKGRPAHNPIIVHVAGIDMARACAAAWPDLATELARSFWPGPLTLVLPRSPAIPEVVTAGGGTVGLRWPSHPMVQAVIRACGFPLAAPSANLANQVSPTTAEHVRRALGDRVGLIVDGGACQVGIESTVLDLSVTPPRVLRPGMIHEESLLAVTGSLALGGGSADVLRSPGMLPKHYAPRARLVMMDWSDEDALRRRLADLGARPERTHLVAHGRIPPSSSLARVCVIPQDPEAFARALYAELHRCDEQGAEWILVETLPEGAAWNALRDRLQRAAAP
jgi:L-threonylcarbamoyladenylate synthase